jgi:hypothetical protein
MRPNIRCDGKSCEVFEILNQLNTVIIDFFSVIMNSAEFYVELYKSTRQKKPDSGVYPRYFCQLGPREHSTLWSLFSF